MTPVIVDDPGLTVVVVTQAQANDGQLRRTDPDPLLVNCIDQLTQYYYYCYYYCYCGY